MASLARSDALCRHALDAVHAGDAGYVVTAEDAAKLVQTVLGPDGPNETRDRLALRGRAFRGAAWGLGAALGRHHRRQSCALRCANLRKKSRSESAAS